MASKSNPLRAVKPDEKAKPRALTVAQAAKKDRRALLVSMRDRVARAVTSAECPPRDLAALTKRLGDIASDLEALDARESEGVDLSARIRLLESALRDVAPDHELLVVSAMTDESDDVFDADAI
ncbi:hypothetical protein MYK68_15945 [Gordonia sp. PP30]|uniref:hypothetical protein n=1 Tax=Gordonia sp. PP30 TaxID=2935861 RepID=UPI001FFFC4AA|nr:hypothetical protein [Gordonia sp. PP30]UQE74203.1 hypothetical protein MYK68_15945 [Gordonia sp. PP30]